MEKSRDAFRTISEVAEWLDTPAHVLRFWESRFTQVKPVKRAGGRRYYRPADMLLLGGIKRLLHEDGMTIRGVQKLLREEGVKHVAGLSAPLDGETPVVEDDQVIEASAEDATVDVEAPIELDVPQEPVDNVVTLTPATESHDMDEPAPESETADDDMPMLPFGRFRSQEPEVAGEAATADTADAAEPEEVSAAPIPIGADIPDDPDDSDPATATLPAGTLLARSLRGKPVANADTLAPILARANALRDRMERNRA